MAETKKLERLLAEAELGLTLALVEPDNVTMTADGKLPQEVAIPDRQMLLAGIQDLPLLTLRRS